MVPDLICPNVSAQPRIQVATDPTANRLASMIGSSWL
jgi:hypothetical protein